MGKKSTFRLLNRGSAKALDKVVELDGINIFSLVVVLMTYIRSILSTNSIFCRNEKGGFVNQNNNS